MTIVIAHKDITRYEGTNDFLCRGMILGSDRQLTDEDLRFKYDSGAKWCANGQFAFGTSGITRFFQLIEANISILKGDHNQSLNNNLVRNICDKIRQLLRDDKFIPADDKGNVEYYKVELLIASKDRIWRCFGDLTPMECKEDWAAIGSGEYVATGVLEALSIYDRHGSARDKVATTIEIVNKYRTDCSGIEINSYPAS